MSNLPFKIVGIEHVALAVENVEMPTKFFGELLGIKHTSTENVVDQKVGTHIFDTNQGKVELLSALSENSPISNFLKKRGEGIHHIAFKVDKLQEALDFLKQNGIELSGTVTSDVEMLICEDKASGSTKIKTAEKKGIPIFSSLEFIEKYKI